MDECGNGDSIISSDGVNLYECISDFNFINKVSDRLYNNRGLQNFAITDKYIYFSYPELGWFDDSNGLIDGMSLVDTDYRNVLKQVSRNYIVRISREDNSFESMYLDYAGHGQSLDANTENDQLYINGFANMYATKKGSNEYYSYSSHSMGLSVTGFYGGNQAILRYPPYSVIFKDINTVERVDRDDYLIDNEIDSEAYYNKILSFDKNDYLNNIYFAVDDVNNQIALLDRINQKVYIYNLSRVKLAGQDDGSITPLRVVDGIGSNQGFELYNDFLYVWEGSTDSEFTISKWNTLTGEREKYATFDLSEYYYDKDAYSWEGEGISIFDGNIYVAAVNRKCISLNGENCDSNKKYVDIFKISGF